MERPRRRDYLTAKYPYQLVEAYSWITCRLEVGTHIITFAVEVQFQIRDKFWVPRPKLNGAMYILDFFVKPKNSLV